MRKKVQNNAKEEPETVTVMFVSQTFGGELAKRLQKEENKIAKMTNERVKVVERGGTTIKQILTKSNPWAAGFCSRAGCLMCENGDGKQNCMEKNIVYQISCLECAAAASTGGDGVNNIDQGRCRLALYIGQTSRTGYERGREHLEGLKKKNENNPLYKHVADKHNDDTNVKFRMTVVKKHFSAFSRLVHEAIKIELISKNSKLVEVLNSRSEIGRVVLPRLVVEQEDNGNVKVIKDVGLECQGGTRAGPEGGGGDHTKLGSQSNENQNATFNFISGPSNAGVKLAGHYYWS